MKFQSGRVWRRLLRDVLDAWSERNSLVRLDIMFKLSNVTNLYTWDYELLDYEELVREVSTYMCIPTTYLGSIFVYLATSVLPVSLTTFQLNYFAFKYGSRPDLIRWEHWVLDFEYAYRIGTRSRFEEYMTLHGKCSLKLI